MYFSTLGSKMLTKCFAKQDGHKRFLITKEPSDSADLGAITNPIKLPVIQYVQDLDDAIALWDGLSGINFYTSKVNYDNNTIHYTLDLSSYDRYTTLREAMHNDGVPGIDDPVICLYISFNLSTTLLDNQPFEASLTIDNLVSDTVVALAESVRTSLLSAQTLTSSNNNNDMLINQHLQQAVDTLNTANGGVSPLMSEHRTFQQ